MTRVTKVTSVTWARFSAAQTTPLSPAPSAAFVHDHTLTLVTPITLVTLVTSI